MRIVFLSCIWVFLCGMSSASADASSGAKPSDYPPTEVSMTLEKVSDHVYYAQGAAGTATENEGFISNAAVIVTDAGVVVFDSLGSPSLAQELLRLLKQITDQPVVKVIVSHYHADHIYGLQVFEDMGIKIWAPSGAQTYINSQQAIDRLEERRISLYPWVNDSTRVVTPDRYLSEPEKFELGGVTMTLTPVGGAHSDADMTLYVEPDRVLLSGDVIFEGRIPFLGDANSANWLSVLNRMHTQGVRALVPGHGPAAADPAGAITLTRDYLAYLRETMGEAVDNFQSFSEAYAQTDWSRFENLPAFEEANRRNAYQVYLALEAESLKAQ